jgi:hypothetical protein
MRRENLQAEPVTVGYQCLVERGGGDIDVGVLRLQCRPLFSIEFDVSVLISNV